MSKLFRSIAMVNADAASMETHRAGVQPGKAFTLKFRPKRKWIWETASGVVIVATLGFLSAHRPASLKLAPQGVFASIDKSKFLLRLSGSDTTGPILAPELVRAWFASVGATGVEETQRVGPGGNKIPEWQIRGILNGNLVEVQVKAYGSSTAFRGIAKGDADIGITSPEMNSTEVAQLMNDFARFSFSAEGQNIVTKARFVLPSGEDAQLSNNPAAIAAPPGRDSLRPAIAEPAAKRNIPPAPARLASAVPPPTAEPAKTPPATAAVVPEAGTRLIKRPPPVLAIVPEPALKALPPVGTIVASLSPPRAAGPALIPPLAINSHAVTFADYPQQSILRQEQGTVVINYLVQEDGSVGDCTVTSSSGKSRLDAAACAMVQGRWKFKPGMQDGKPVAKSLTAEVVFKLADLPKEPRPTIMALLDPPPEPPVVKVTPDQRLPTPPEAINSHGVLLSDYPPISVRLKEQGTVVVKYLVKEDGSVGNCTVTKPSGKALLDEAACAMVTRRWKFRPAMKDDKPVAAFLTAEVAFTLK